MDSFNTQELLAKLLKYRYLFLCFLIGLVLVGLGVIFFKSGINAPTTKIEVLQGTTLGQESLEITAEIAGEVLRPGVYKLSGNSRVDDLLIVAGGFSAGADREWTDKYLNRAAKLTDGQKVYIPSANQQSDVLGAKSSGGDQTVSSLNQSDSTSLININTASLGKLDTLPGIGQTYGQKIIEHRPYSNTTELVSKGVIGKSLYDKIKDKISIF